MGQDGNTRLGGGILIPRRHLVLAFLFECSPASQVCQVCSDRCSGTTGAAILRLEHSMHRLSAYW